MPDGRCKTEQQQFKTHFLTKNSIHVDDDGFIHASGSVGIRQEFRPISQLPVKFGRVEGDFFCDECGLETLAGAPTWVGGAFWCQYNRLTSLQHAPRHVGADFRVFYNKLTNLHHAPEHVGGEFECYGNDLTSLEGLPEQGVKKLVLTYNTHLPLLRCLTAHDVYLGHVAPKMVSKIIQRHVGTGKKGALQAAAELIKAGYKDNARW